MKNNSIVSAGTAACLVLVPTALCAQTAARPQNDEAQSEVVVTATRSGDGVRADLLGSSFTVIEPRDFEQRQVRIVSDVLRDVPGISVSRTGTVGGLTQVRMRGAEGNHTLVLIDGIEASDPYYGEFDFATLIADDIARVEVLRGQQSALYGSDAIGGVINYITLSGREAPGVRARIEGGSFGTTDISARAAGVAGAFDYSLSAGYQNTDGVPTSRFGTRDVGAQNTAASGRFTYTASDTARLKAVVRYIRTEADTNDQSFTPGPTYGFVIDSDDYYENHALFALVRGEIDTLEGRWTHAVSAQGVDAKRDGYSEGLFDYGDDGARQRYSYESTLRFGSDSFRQALTAALDYERETYQNRGPFLSDEQMLERENTNKGLVVQYDGSVNDRLGFGAALRYDDNERFESETTFRVQGSYRFDTGTRLRAAAGSGLKNPGIFELFGYDPSSYIGNPSLKPEKSSGWEIGVEQRFAENRASIGITYFDSKLKDEIYTEFLPGFVSTPANRTTDSTQDGIEVALNARPSDAWNVDLSYTYLDAQENGVEEVRRPPHIASLNVGWRALGDRAGLALTVRYNGSTYDNNFTTVVAGPRVLLPAFTLVNLGGDWKVSDLVQVYGRIENLFDEDYEEVFTFRTPGRGAYLGARLTF